MKGLSLWQPWASLMAIGAKRIETRSWRTSYRGLVCIHAAKHRGELDWCSHGTFRSALAKAGIRGPADLPFGALIAIGELVDCIYIQGPPVRDESAFGNCEPGRYAWRFGNVRRISPTIPWRGRQGLFDLDDAVLERASIQHPPGAGIMV